MSFLSIPEIGEKQWALKDSGVYGTDSWIHGTDSGAYGTDSEAYGMY